MKPLERITGSPAADLVRRGWLPGIMDLGFLLPNYFRIAFLGAGLRSGILQRLSASPATLEELISDLELDASLADGLASWLDLGVQLRELSLRGGRYSLRSRRAKALVKPENDPLAAMYEELVDLDHRLVVETPARLKEGRPFALGDAESSLIARSSRLGEPWLAEAISRLVPAEGPVRLLEVGCGSAAHIRTACEHNPQLTAVGLELQDGAAALARRNVAAWGLGERVSVESGDVRDREPAPEFDVVTLHQNIYYFPAETQADVLRHLAGFLRPGGRLVVTSIVRGSGLVTNGLDLWGGMTEGAERLPVVDDVVAKLRAAGLAEARAEKLGPDGMYYAFVGEKA